MCLRRREGRARLGARRYTLEGGCETIFWHCVKTCVLSDWIQWKRSLLSTDTISRLKRSDSVKAFVAHRVSLPSARKQASPPDVFAETLTHLFPKTPIASPYDSRGPRSASEGKLPSARGCHPTPWGSCGLSASASHKKHLASKAHIIIVNFLSRSVVAHPAQSQRTKLIKWEQAPHSMESPFDALEMQQHVHLRQQ